jgi:hypothetical protein
VRRSLGMKAAIMIEKNMRRRRDPFLQESFSFVVCIELLQIYCTRFSSSGALRFVSMHVFTHLFFSTHEFSMVLVGKQFRK